MRSQMLRILIAVAFAVLSSPTLAGGRGGHVTSWEPNILGGGWVCFGPAITGCSQGFDARCAGGSTNDSTAADAVNVSGLNPLKLYIPPGSRCFISGNPFLFGIPNATVWAYGAYIDSIITMSAFAYYDDNSHDALVQTVSAGSCSVTLVTAGDASKFAVNDWLQVGNIAMASFGNPMTMYASEAVLVTAISAPTINISPCLRNSYKSTYPVPGVSPDSFQGGPATIWKMRPEWNANTRWFGITIGDGQTVISGRTIQLTDVVFNFPPGQQNTPAPSSPGNIWISGGYMPSTEIDKNIGLLNILRSSMRNVFAQSAGSNVRITSSSIDNLVGTTTNTTLTNTRVGFAFVGPLNAPGTNLTLDGSTISSLLCSNTNVDTSTLSFSSGTFSIANSAAVAAGVYAAFVPGLTYYFGETDGTNDSVPHTQFEVSDLRQDGTNTYIDIANCSWGACSGALPTPTCNGHGCFRYVAYQVNNLSSKFSTAPGLSTCVK